MPETRGAAVTVRNLAKRYGRIEALRGITFETAPGEIFGLLGRNGAGKTTTLECVLGLRQPDAGEVRVGGVDVAAEPARAKALLGAQLQAATLQDKMTAREALRFFGSFYRHAAPVAGLLADFGLEATADTPFAALSGGQQRRLFLALAFVNEPQAVVLDEPTAGLDPQARRELHAMITRARDHGAAVLVSTHALDEAEMLCDRVGILHEGKLLALGRPAELRSRSRRGPRLALRTERPFDVQALRRLAPFAGRTPNGAGADRNATASQEASLECTDVNAAIGAAVQHLSASGNTLLDLRIERPTLEDVFLELTGQPWTEKEEG